MWNIWEFTQLPSSPHELAMSSTPRSHGSPTPTSTPPLAQPSSSSYISYPVSHVVSSLYRRLTDSALPSNSRATPSTNNGLYTPPRRTASPFQPPPLTPLSLRGFDSRTFTPILSRTLAEEIRLLLPPRLQLVESWVLAYSLEQDGVSLGTLYHKCASPNLPLQSSFVLVVRDAAGGVRIFLSFPNCGLPSSLDLPASLDIRCLSYVRPAPLCYLLWYRRMFSLACLAHSELISAFYITSTTPIGAHRCQSPSKHHPCQS